MGNTHGSSTKGPIISVEEARTYISDEEYRRLRAAFSGFKKQFITYDEFCYHVLGGARIPEDRRRELFLFCSRNAETLSFDNLLTALVGLCRVEQVQEHFIEECKDFASWGLRPPLLTIPMSDAYISFYEVMSYVTHLSVAEVMELEKVFATISDRSVCKLSKDRWDAALCGCFPKKFTDQLFRVFDDNGDNQIDFRELVCGLSAMCRGPFPSRLSFLAKLWDEDCDAMLSDAELEEMYTDLNVPEGDRMVAKSSGDKAAVVDFATWANDNEYAKEYYAMAMEVGHICLGLRPESHRVGFALVNSFEYRSKKLPLPEWNIVSSVWHSAWFNAAAEGKAPPPVDNSAIKGTKADDGWSGKVACLSLESANLRIDLSSKDYIAVPPVLWRAWLRWHGSAQSVDGQFTRKRLGGEFFLNGREALELYPLDILLLGHDKKKVKDVDGIQQLSPWACAQVSRSCTVDELLQLCRNELRLGDGDARLWLVGDEGNTLLDEGQRTLHQLTVKGKRVNKFLLELRDSNGVWPEELRASLTGAQISSLACTTGRPGAVGLVNSGNFCYRNAAIQCLARGDANNNASFATTLEYSKLLKEMWSTKNKNISPNGFNEAVRFAEQFDDGEQHDCQEFVSFLIERFHTCVAKMENGDSIIDGERSYETRENANEEATRDKYEASDEAKTDEEKAEKAWKDYQRDNHSLVTSLFSGQLRSRLICRKCKSASSVFEVFTSLSLPIGFENVELYQITVVRRDGSVPRRYGFRLPRECTVGAFKGLVAEASGVSRDALTVQCLSKRGCFMNPSNTEDNIALSSVPSGARLYALQLPEDTPDWRVAIHRKLQYNYEPYFLGATGGFIVTQFGLPLIVPCPMDITGKQLYEDVMVQMRRFMDTSSPTISTRAHDPSEDISFGYPFSLCLADESWEWCGQCSPLRFCRGCLIKPDSCLANIPKNCGIAVDWLPIALYLKYNHSQELACEDDESVAETWSRHFAPSSLEHCLERFSCPETLDALIHCEMCNEKTKRDKVMTIWRLPRYLIIHLKRFEFLRYEKRMGKCKRVITFPLKQFDPASFVDGKGERSKYECIAIANHYGQLSSGHFVAYARGSGEKWLLLNDCSVKEVTEEEVDRASAYLLFFERKD
ncbi:cytokinesis protein 3 [Parelaphostrongylus tenuis]|uniref:ubiquitinyl hydrolase 1 n=1 Tax=Parelaphostrongylus tenuis TaxID=148309 RepID=A0AAD5R8K9_PARTN|nr:cytokinesis protein 3 [Parelaphostrongylus tenuis]